jgi:hypothetical protein
VKQPFALLLALVTVGGCSVGALSPPAPSSSTTGSSAASRADTGSSLVAIGAGLTGPAGLAATVYAAGPADVSALASTIAPRRGSPTAAHSDGGTDGIYLVAGAGATTEIVPGLHTVLGLVWYRDESVRPRAG